MDPWSILIYLALMAVSYALAPKPKVSNAEVQEGAVPAASASNPIPVVFGEVEIKQANVVWWGDQGADPIYSSGGKK